MYCLLPWRSYQLTANVCCCACLQRDMPARSLAHPQAHLPGAALRPQPWCTANGWRPERNATISPSSTIRRPPCTAFDSLAGAVRVQLPLTALPACQTPTLS